MSQPVSYSFFGEDAAQRNFLSRYLDQRFSGLFVENDKFKWQIKVKNRDQVDKTLPAALQLKAILRIDVLFVGRDSDTANSKVVQELRDHFAKVCTGHQAVIIMIPVQCIEHWLWYLKRRKESPGKNSPLETYNRSEAKTAVYGGKYNVERQLEKADELLNGLDVDWLESRSESFKQFHQQVLTFLNNHQTTQP